MESISVSISGENFDDPSGNIQLHVNSTRKRQKRKFRKNEGLFHKISRIFRHWWPLLPILSAIALLFFNISKLRLADPKPVMEVQHSNLNRLDPVTRVVGGVRQPCLKLLIPEEIQNLDFPDSNEPEFPIKTVVYKSESEPEAFLRNKLELEKLLRNETEPEDYTLGANSTLLTNSAENMCTRFNGFTGAQTFQEREESFKANETVAVHCGFYSGQGGFKISDKDKNYMQTCKAVVLTCAFGGGDDLYQPIGMTESTLEKVCFVAFWDDITIHKQESEGINIDNEGMIGKWRIIVVKDLPFSDQRLNGKIPKMLGHRLFPQTKYSIWVDSKSQLRRDPIGVLEALLWRTNSVLAISEHGARSSLYDEAKAVVKKNKAAPEEVEVQLNQYRKDGIPDDKRFNGMKALSEASIIVREHTPLTNLFMCVWFNEVVRFTSRDQLSFPYVLRRLNMPGINMFPVCTRKDLVNSMGHIRKVKPRGRLW